MKAILSWSSGKDSAWALHTLRTTRAVEVVGLLTTVSETFDRVSMHGVRRSLVEAQARAAGLPLHIVEIPTPCPNDVYEARMAAFVGEARKAGIEAIVFGDLFLADIRAYRESRLMGTGLSPLFPIWQTDTAQLAQDMIAAGLKARIVTLDPGRVPRSAIGKEFDGAFIRNLPPGVDHCGENGEFHTFAYDGPMFDAPIDVAIGETSDRDGFVYVDLAHAQRQG